VGQKFQVVAYDIQNIVMCYSVIYEFLSANSVYLQVGNAELDVKEGQILDIEGAPKPWLLGSGLVLSNCSRVFRSLQSLPHLFDIPASYFCKYFDIFLQHFVLTDTNKPNSQVLSSDHHISTWLL
jgi:hypothetical protein